MWAGKGDPAQPIRIDGLDLEKLRSQLLAKVCLFARIRAAGLDAGDAGRWHACSKEGWQECVIGRPSTAWGIIEKQARRRGRPGQTGRISSCFGGAGVRGGEMRASSKPFFHMLWTGIRTGFSGARGALAWQLAFSQQLVGKAPPERSGCMPMYLLPMCVKCDRGSGSVQMLSTDEHFW